MYVLNLSFFAVDEARTEIADDLRKLTEAYQHTNSKSFPLAFILFLQAVSTISALSPTTVAQVLSAASLGDHVSEARTYGAYALGSITMIGLVVQYSKGRLGGAEYIRMSMPLLLHAVGWMQMRSERDVERELEGLEKSKYHMKGA